MERLTRNFTEMEDGAEYTSCVQCDIRHICMWKDRYTKEAYTGGCFLMDIYERLAAYEDTGLTPGEARSLWGEWNAMMQVLNSIGGYDRLRELAAANKEGHVVVLPCKIGDTVFTNYRVAGDYMRLLDAPYAAKVTYIGLNDCREMGYGHINIEYVKTGRQIQLYFSDIGTKVFLTHDEAEEELRRAGNG